MLAAWFRVALASTCRTPLARRRSSRWPIWRSTWAFPADRPLSPRWDMQCRKLAAGIRELGRRHGLSSLNDRQFDGYGRSRSGAVSLGVNLEELGVALGMGAWALTGRIARSSRRCLDVIGACRRRLATYSARYWTDVRQCGTEGGRQEPAIGRSRPARSTTCRQGIRDLLAPFFEGT